MLDQVAARMRAAGAQAEFDPVDVMLANKDFLAVLETIDAPHSMFEQYYGLLLAGAMLSDLDPLRRRLLGDGIARARRKRRVRHDEPLMGISHNLLDRLGQAS